MATVWRKTAEFHLKTGEAKVAAESLEELQRLEPSLTTLAQLVTAYAKCDLGQKVFCYWVILWRIGLFTHVLKTKLLTFCWSESRPIFYRQGSCRVQEVTTIPASSRSWRWQSRGLLNLWFLQFYEIMIRRLAGLGRHSRLQERPQSQGRKPPRKPRMMRGFWWVATILSLEMVPMTTFRLRRRQSRRGRRSYRRTIILMLIQIRKDGCPKKRELAWSGFEFFSQVHQHLFQVYAWWV